MKRILFVSILMTMILLVTVVSYVLFTESGLKRVVSVIFSKVPEITFESVHGRLVGPLEFKGLRYTSDTFSIFTKEFFMNWKPSRLFFLESHITHMSAKGIRIESWESDKPGQPDTMLPQIVLPVTVVLENISFNDISFLQDGRDLPVQIQEVSLKARADQERITIDRVSVTSDKMLVSLSGNMMPQKNYPLTMELDWSYHPEGYPMFKGNGSFDGDLTLLNISQSINEPFTARASLMAHELLHALRWEGTIDLEDLSLQHIKRDWPEMNYSAKMKGTGTMQTAHIQGTCNVLDKQYGSIMADIDVLYDADTLTFHKIAMSRQESTEKIDLTGTYSLQENLFDIRGTWNALKWPLTGDVEMNSHEGSFDVKGGMERYEFIVNGILSGRDIPESNMMIQGNGTDKSIDLTSLEAHLLDGSIKGSGRGEWSPHVKWNITLAGKSLNPGVHVKDWPGKLDLRLISDGSVRDKDLSFSLNELELTGSLRGYPFRADAQFDMKRNVYRLSRFLLRSGAASVSGSGTYADRVDAVWNINIPSLEELLPGGKGALRGEGRIEGEAGSPRINAHMKGEKISYGGYHAERVNIDADVYTSDKEYSRFDLSAERIDVNFRDISTLSVQANGTLSSHKMILRADSRKDSAEIVLDAGFYDDAWKGRVNKGTARLSAFGTWKVKDPVSFMISEKESKTDRWCWLNNSSSLCLQPLWKKNEGLHVSAAASRIQLSLAKEFIPESTDLKGTFDALIDLHYDGQKVSGHLSLDIPEGVVAFRQEEDQVSIPFEAVRINAELNDEGLGVTSQVQLPERGFINTKAFFMHFDPFAFDSERQVVSGELKAELEALDFIPLGTSKLVSTRGMIRSDLKVEGTLSQPFITGHVIMADGHAVIPDLGITLRDMQLNLQGKESGQLVFSGQGGSGKGQVTFRGTVGNLKGEHIAGSLQMKGENFEIVKIPGTWMLISPEVNMNFKGNKIAFDGKVLIPEALIEPPDLSGALSVSRDVKIVGESPEKVTADTIEVSANVLLTFGENVRFKGYGLTGRITGGMNVIEEPGKMTAGQGQLTVQDGQYKAYGQELVIEQGRLIFVGPIEDPGLDIRAVRHIKEIIAGVQVRGTLLSPQLRVFSIPSMDEADALSYVLFGRPMTKLSQSEGNQLYGAAVSAGLSGGGIIAKKIGTLFGIEDVEVEKGVTPEEAALFLGTYLTPELYISYGIGLFRPINTLRLRYSLTTNWLLQSEYGVESSGDILYKIER